jgi:peptide deformylase
MAIYPIRTFGDPVLRTPTALVQEIDDGIRRLVADMIDTMYDAPGVGLAAPQIGVSKRVAVFDAQDGTGAHVLVNPVLLETSGEYEFDEGCLSVPGHYWTINRPAFARVSGLGLDGSPVEYAGDGLLGRVLQHEIDHLDGRLLIDQLGPLTRRRALRDLRDEALGLVEYE